jgi:hypothetical protein
VVLDPQEGGSTSGTQPGNNKIQPNPNPLGTKIHLRNKTKNSEAYPPPLYNTKN